MTGELGLSGYEGGFYVDPAGDYATTPTWAELDAAINTDMQATRGGGEIVNRGLSHAVEVDGLMRLPITVTGTYRTENKTGYEALRDAFLNKSVIAIANMTQKIATIGSEGWQYNARVKAFQMPQQLEDGVEFTFELAPSANSPNSVEGAYVEITV